MLAGSLAATRAGVDQGTRIEADVSGGWQGWGRADRQVVSSCLAARAVEAATAATKVTRRSGGRQLD